MTRIKSILFATFLTLAVSSSVFAGEITGRKGEITGRAGEITGRSGVTSTGLVPTILSVISMVV